MGADRGLHRAWYIVVDDATIIWTSVFYLNGRRSFSPPTGRNQVRLSGHIPCNFFSFRFDDVCRFILLQDYLGTIKEADFLVGRSLLRKRHGGDYLFHDLMLDFIRRECDCTEFQGLSKGAVERQRQYLGRLAVLRRYSDVGEHLHTDLYALMRL